MPAVEPVRASNTGGLEAFRRIRPYRSILLAVALLAVALLLRTAFLGDRQLFRDEAASWLLAGYPLPQLVAHAAGEPYPPFYAVVLKGWISLTGDSEVALRSLSTIFGLAMVLIGWKWANESLGRRIGLIALALLAISPLAIANARDARMYAMDSAWTTLGWWLIWRLASGRSIGLRRGIDAVALVVAIAAELWTFSFGLPVVALQFAVSTVAWIRNRHIAGALAPAAIVAGGATFLPWLPTTIASAGGRPFWTPTPDPDDLRYAFTLMIGGWDSPWMLGASIALVFAGVGIVVLASGRAPVLEGVGPKSSGMPLLGAAVIAGLALVPLVWLYSQFHSFYDSRYFGASVVPLAIAAATGCNWAFTRVRPRVAKGVAGISLALLLLGGTLAWLDGWKSEVGLAPARELLSLLEQRMRPGDVALALDARSYFPLAYLAGREEMPVRLPGPLFSWYSGREPFYYGRSLLSPEKLVSQSETDATGWYASLPGLEPGGNVWLIALANGASEDLGFQPLEAGEVSEVGRIVLAPTGEPGLLVELVVTGTDMGPASSLRGN
jgi:mannosyltransferase